MYKEILSLLKEKGMENKGKIDTLKAQQKIINEQFKVLLAQENVGEIQRKQDENRVSAVMKEQQLNEKLLKELMKPQQGQATTGSNSRVVLGGQQVDAQGMPILQMPV